MPRYVIQEHCASSYHFDSRLERDGVLLSWAVPKGMPTDTAKIRLAIRVEDRTPVDGEGAVKVSIWDRGAYGAKSFSEDEKIVVLCGERLEGSYAIFRTRDGNWLIHRMVSQT